MTSIDYWSQANAMRDELIARRRDFHMYPELAFEEVRTARIVAEHLTQLGMEVQIGVGKTGVIGILEGEADGPTVLVRADMDALPITEENETEYVSTTGGKMHACGHDGHTSIALGVATLFANHRDKIAGRIKFVFQPAEEIGAGANAMVKDGALENPKPDVSLALHLWNDIPLGKLGVADGPVMAAAGVFKIQISGSGGHGASPHYTVDPVVCAAQIVMALQTIVSRNADPLDQAVVSVTQIHTGTANNIIPERALLSGTIRTFRPKVHELVTRRMWEIVEHTATAMNCKAELEISNASKPVVNHPEVSQTVRHAFQQIGIPEDQFLLDERTMGAEDVGVFMTDTPGMFFFLGCANPGRGLDYAHHHPRFDFDEEALPMGVALLSAAVGEYVIKEA